MTRKKLNVKKLIIFLAVVLVLGSLLIFILGKLGIGLFNPGSKMYLASNEINVLLYDENFNNVKELPRGTDVIIYKNKKISDDTSTYFNITHEKETFYIKEENLVSKKEESVLEKEVYVRTPVTILENLENGKIKGHGSKGSKLEVLDFVDLQSNGSVKAYKVKQGDIEGYVYSKYVVLSEEEANKNYNSEELDAIHSKIKNSYGGGSAINLDYYPIEKVSFENNVMPEQVYALYLNNGSGTINNIDSYIEFAKETKINAFVVDIKENEMPGYDSEVMKELSPTNYENARNSKESFGNAIKKLKDAGFYVIGRITVFKDKYYAMDNPSAAMTSKATGEPYLYTNTYWPSPYSRDVWYFNVALAKEAITEFGFNEINFDYVRFPDRLQTIERNNLVDFHNTYEEEKAQAIQRFLMYACDEIHALGAYVSVDVFGEATNGYYTTAYGQYWPAISNVVDVISGMPYPDHFAAGNYGIAKPWNEPYKLMNAWAKEAMKRQDETTSPAIVRTWIQAYDTQNYVDPNGLDYNSEAVKAEVEGLFDGGATGGYMTWLSSSNLSKYKAQKEAYSIDYK